MNKVIEARKNKLSNVISFLSDEELCAVFEEITDFKDCGILPEHSNLARIARELHEKFNVPYDIRMVEDDVLYEAARRFYNEYQRTKWVDIQEELPKDNGHLQKFLVCRNRKSATNGNVSIDTEFFTNEFKNPDKITHWMKLPVPPNHQ